MLAFGICIPQQVLSSQTHSHEGDLCGPSFPTWKLEKGEEQLDEDVSEVKDSSVSAAAVGVATCPS